SQVLVQATSRAAARGAPRMRRSSRCRNAPSTVRAVWDRSPPRAMIGRGSLLRGGAGAGGADPRVRLGGGGRGARGGGARTRGGERGAAVARSGFGDGERRSTGARACIGRFGGGWGSDPGISGRAGGHDARARGAPG